MSPFPGNVNQLRHEDLHPQGKPYDHEDIEKEFPLTVYHGSETVKDEGDNEVSKSKIVKDEKELEAARAEGYAPRKKAVPAVEE